MSDEFKNESELAETLIPWLRAQGWELYFEVQCGSYGARPDIVALRNGVTWTIETKLTFGIKLLEQAAGHRFRSNYISVCIPSYRRRNNFLEKLFGNFGIGLLVASKGEGQKNTVYEVKRPQFYRKGDQIKKYLKEKQKDYSAPGNDKAAYWTPLKEVERNINAYIKKNPGALFGDVIKNIDHHYATPASAKGAIKRWIEDGIIKGVILTKEGRNLRAYPALEWGKTCA